MVLSASTLTLRAAFRFAQDAAASDTHQLVVFAGIAAISLAFLAVVVLIVLVALLVIALKARAAVTQTVNEVKSKAYPIVEKANGIIGDLRPQIAGITEKVHIISGNAADISNTVKQKVDEFAPTVSAVRETVSSANVTAQDANRKTHEQILRVNTMITEALNASARIGQQFQEGVSRPLRQANGYVSGFKAAFDSLKSKSTGFGAGFTAKADRSQTRPPARPSNGSTPETPTSIPHPSERLRQDLGR